MSKFDLLFESLSKEKPNRELQIAAVDTVSDCLEQIKNSLGYWEKKCISSAIVLLAQNIGDGTTATNTWLSPSPYTQV